jgi:radical SAM superfamily enzyme YgiQ (UPF0313 family)
MDLLLTHGYFLFEDPKEQAIMKPYVPLGILYLASHLKKRGIEVEIYDSTFGSREELRRILHAGPPSILGIYSNLMTRRNVLELIATARAAGWTTVLGGPEPAAYAEEYLAAGAGVIIEGEGEVTLEELLAAYKSEPRIAGSRVPEELLRRIDGIIFQAGDNSICRTPARRLIQNLDAQPWPDREQVDIAQYLNIWRRHHGMGSVSVISARGCPYHCRWCSHATFGKTHRRRTPSGVADEIAWILERYQPEMIWVADDVFTIHHAWILQFAEEMKRRGLRVPFECITRADRLNPRIADTLSALGCFRIWIGSESGSQRILDAMERGVTVEQVREAVRLCRERGIQTGMFLMWGYEGEELSDIEATVEHVKASLPDTFLTTVSYPIKGTPYYDEVAPRLVNGTHWKETTDRELKISGRHSRQYYQWADQLLKSEVALHRLMTSNSATEAPVSDLKSQIEAARQGLLQTESEVEA